jgi:hypothetical protein
MKSQSDQKLNASGSIDADFNQEEHFSEIAETKQKQRIKIDGYHV